MGISASKPTAEEIENLLDPAALPAQLPENILFTALHLNRPDLVRRLVEKGVDPNWQNVGLLGSETALHLAIILNQTESAYCIAEHMRPAAINARFRQDGRTALHMAATNGNVVLISTLLHYGADANLRNAAGCTALWITCRWHNPCSTNRIECAEKLASCMSAEAINFPETETGETALHLAARAGELALVNILLHRHADRRAEAGFDHHTPFDYAVLNGASDEVTSLLYSPETPHPVSIRSRQVRNVSNPLLPSAPRPTRVIYDITPEINQSFNSRRIHEALNGRNRQGEEKKYHFNEHTQNYINAMEASTDPTMAERIFRFNPNPDEKKQLKDYIDPLTNEYMKTPVLLNEEYYDLETVKKLNGKDPNTREPFSLEHIQSGRKLINRLEEETLPNLKEKRQQLQAELQRLQTVRQTLQAKHRETERLQGQDQQPADASAAALRPLLRQ